MICATTCAQRVAKSCVPEVPPTADVAAWDEFTAGFPKGVASDDDLISELGEVVATGDESIVELGEVVAGWDE